MGKHLQKHPSQTDQKKTETKQNTNQYYNELRNYNYGCWHANRGMLKQVHGKKIVKLNKANKFLEI